MTEREYRDDDRDCGYCPHCGKPLTGVTRAALGYCEQHGWVWAEWTPKKPPTIYSDAYAEAWGND